MSIISQNNTFNKFENAFVDSENSFTTYINYSSEPDEDEETVDLINEDMFEAEEKETEEKEEEKDQYEEDDIEDVYLEESNEEEDIIRFHSTIPEFTTEPRHSPRRRGGNGNRERKRTPANMDIRQYDRLEMILEGETWWIECYDTEGFGAFEVIYAPYRRDLEGYIFRKGDRISGERKIISPINFIFQQFVESVGIPRQKRTPWTCIYKWRNGVSIKLDWV